MMRRRWPCAIVAALLGVLAPAGNFLAHPTSPPRGAGLRVVEPADGDRAKLLGVLTFTKMSVSLDDVPARDAFAAVSEALGVSIVGRWSSDKAGHGLDAEARVTMHVERVPARQVIEELLEQCEEYEDCTWQLRTGMIEVGTKARLAVPAARERLRYDLTDLLLEPPYFAHDPGGFAKMDTPYVDSVLGEESREALRNGDPPPRKTKPMIIHELVEGLSETIEPGHWDVESIMNPGATTPVEEADEEEAASPTSPPDASAPSGGGKPAKATKTSVRRNAAAWASAREFRDSLFITAPDFMHRQIGGYPQPIRPADVETVRVVTSPAATNR